MRSSAHDEAMAELYRGDPALAFDVINDVLEDGYQAELLTVLRQLAQAFGGGQTVAEQARLNPTQLYRTFSPSPEQPDCHPQGDGAAASGAAAKRIDAHACRLRSG